MPYFPDILKETAELRYTEEKIFNRKRNLQWCKIFIVFVRKEILEINATSEFLLQLRSEEMCNSSELMIFYFVC